MTLESLFARAPQSDEDFKACCAVFYEMPAVRFLLGQSWRPGGIALTREIAEAAGVDSQSRVLDIACGSGDSAQVTAGEKGGSVVGLDLSAGSLALAAGRFAAEDWWRRTGWTAGEAERLPFADASFDVAMVECAFCTFPDKAASLAEIRRVLRPGGRLVISDVTLLPDELPAALAGPVARVTCLADALPASEYVALLRQAGFSVDTPSECGAAVEEFLASIDKKLLLARIAQVAGKGGLDGIDIKEARRLLALAREAAARGVLGYVYLIAHPG